MGVCAGARGDQSDTCSNAHFMCACHTGTWCLMLGSSAYMYHTGGLVGSTC